MDHLPIGRSSDGAFRLFVGNMSSQTTEEQLREMVGKFGSVRDVYVIKVRTTGESRGFAFVEMTDEQAANRAIDALNGARVAGRCLKVRLGF